VLRARAAARRQSAEDQRERGDAAESSEPQLTALFTSVAIVFSSAAVSFVSAKELGHIVPSSRFALSLKPRVAYLVLNFCPL
jgi:hypothetical protein